MIIFVVALDRTPPYPIRPFKFSHFFCSGIVKAQKEKIGNRSNNNVKKRTSLPLSHYLQHTLRLRAREEKSKRINLTYVSRAEDGPVPVGHQHIIAVLQSVTAGAIANALLSLLELLHQLEVTGNYVFEGGQT